MAKKVSLNQVGGSIITAEEAVSRYKNGYRDRFFCSGNVDGEICGCEMILCALGSVKKSPYFVGRTGHLRGCPNYINEKIRIKNKYGRISRDPNAIDINHIVTLTAEQSSGGEIVYPLSIPPVGLDEGEKEPVPVVERFHQFKVPKTISELYYALKANSVETIYQGGYRAADYLIDDRVYNLYRMGEMHLHSTGLVIAGKLLYKDIRDKVGESTYGRRWVMMDPYIGIPGKYDPRIIYVLDFKNDDLFNEMLNKYFLNSKKKNNIYVISANDWNIVNVNLPNIVYHANIYNKKQIVLLSKEVSKEQYLASTYKEQYE